MSRHDEIAAELAEKLEKEPREWVQSPETAAGFVWISTFFGRGEPIFKFRGGDGGYGKERERRERQAELVCALKNKTPLLLRERAALVDVERAARSLDRAADLASTRALWPKLTAALAALDAIRGEKVP